MENLHDLPISTSVRFAAEVPLRPVAADGAAAAAAAAALCAAGSGAGGASVGRTGGGGDAGMAADWRQDLGIFTGFCGSVVGDIVI